MSGPIVSLEAAAHTKRLDEPACSQPVWKGETRGDWSTEALFFVLGERIKWTTCIVWFFRYLWADIADICWTVGPAGVCPPHLFCVSSSSSAPPPQTLAWIGLNAAPDCCHVSRTQSALEPRADVSPLHPMCLASKTWSSWLLTPTCVLYMKKHKPPEIQRQLQFGLVVSILDLNYLNLNEILQRHA